MGPLGGGGGGGSFGVGGDLELAYHIFDHKCKK